MKHTFSILAALAFGAVACSDDPDNALAVNSRTRTTAQLVQFNSCGELQQRLRENLKEEMKVQLVQYLEFYGNGRGGIGFAEDSAAAAPAAEGAAADAGRQEGVDFSGTNNQETGVDEADFVKTDGFHIYMLNGNRLEIFGTPEFGDLLPESSSEVEGYPRQMLIGEDRVAVFSTISPWSLPEEHPLRAYIGGTYDGRWYYWGKNLTKVTIFDVSDRTAPSLVRELYMEGWHSTARRVGSTVRTISYAYRDLPGLIYWPELPDNYWQVEDEGVREEIMKSAVLSAIRSNNALIDATDLEDLTPLILERRPSGNIIRHSFTQEGCTNFAIADDGTSRGFTSIMSFDLVDVESRFESDHIVSNHSEVYASGDTLVLAEYAQDWWWFWRNDDFEEATNIHRFDISQPGRTFYTGSGRIPGTVNDQFSLSEYEGFIRVASTVGTWNRWWLDQEEQIPALNYVFVLDGEKSLEIVGRTAGVAPDERIWSARFVEDKAFLVTFRNVDPLYTVDLTEPTDPKIIGELKVPGVSTYIHPLEDETHLLTIGIAGDDEGLFWGQTQLSLFNVSDFENPTLASDMRMVPENGDGWYYAYSEAQWEHKAFQYWAPRETLAIPLSTYREDYDAQTGEWQWEYSTRLELVSVDAESETLSSAGAIDHSSFFNQAPDVWWGSPSVRRSIFMGDFIYAISNRGVTAHNLDTMTLSASEVLPGTNDSPYWWW